MVHGMIIVWVKRVWMVFAVLEWMCSIWMFMRFSLLSVCWCCLWALGLLLWWVSEGVLVMLAFVCECWFMIYCYCVYCLLRWLSLQGWCDDSEEVLLMFVRENSFRVSECRAVSQCGECIAHDGFHWFHVFNECCCSVLWMWCGNHSVIVVNSERNCKMERNDARSWIIWGLTGNDRIDRCRHCSLFQWACRRWMSSWMHEMTPRSGHTCMYGMMRIAMISWIELLMMFSARRLGISMSRVKGIFHVVMIAFITEMQEQTDNRGSLLEMGSRWIRTDVSCQVSPVRRNLVCDAKCCLIMPACVIILLAMLVPWVFSHTVWLVRLYE